VYVPTATRTVSPAVALTIAPLIVAHALSGARQVLPSLPPGATYNVRAGSAAADPDPAETARAAAIMINERIPTTRFTVTAPSG